MKQLKVVDRANELLDGGMDAKEAVAELVSDAPDEEKIEWFDEFAATYLVYQLASERRKADRADAD